MNSETPLWKYAVIFSYVGTGYCGWQRQKGSAAEGGPSIQATIEASLKQMTGESSTVVGSGRTDSGVHALGQRAHFVLRQKPWPSEILLKGLNSLLPSDIRALEVVPVPLEFHAQHSALKKQYSYYFQQGPCAVPFLEPYSWWIRKPLNLDAMNEAISCLRGAHDFKPFQASGSPPGRTTLRKILEAEVVSEKVHFPGSVIDGVFLVRVRILGTGFLKQMVRGIAGTLLQVGENRRDSLITQTILEKGDRSLVGPTAPGRGLWLERVWY
ncbi:tRNA pseudouridine(38-40) synthase TruA [Bdellovibrionota bacterium FG-1]